METIISSMASILLPREPTNYDEVSMHQSLLFSDSLKDLRNLRQQLYTAAEYFELSHNGDDDQKKIVVNALKDYTIKALVNTVDHLGSVTYKVNDFLDETIDEVTDTGLRISCIEQRLRTCQQYTDNEGLSQQSLVIETPKYHKRYILPVGETMRGENSSDSNDLRFKLDPVDDWHQLRNAVRATITEMPSTKFGKMQSPLPTPTPTPQTTQQSGRFKSSTTMPPKRETEKQSVSPHRFPLLRSGSFSGRPTTPKGSQKTTPIRSRATTPTPSFGRRQYPSQPQKSASMRFPAEKVKVKDVEQSPSKSKRLLNALLSRRKSKKDEMLYTYLDEYS